MRWINRRQATLDLVANAHITDWLEAQLDLIKQVGYENYLTQQIKD